MRNLLEDGKRKVVVTLGTMGVIWATATLLTVFGSMTCEQWSQLMQWLLPWGAGIFVVGNGIEHVASVLKTPQP